MIDVRIARKFALERWTESGSVPLFAEITRKMDTFLTRQKRKLDMENENDSSRKKIVKMSRKEKDCHSDSTKRNCIGGKQFPLLKKLKADGLDCDYYRLYTKTEADEIFRQCEEQLVFNTGKESQVQVFGKWHEIRRKQVSPVIIKMGLSYPEVILQSLNFTFQHVVELVQRKSVENSAVTNSVFFCFLLGSTWRRRPHLHILWKDCPS